MSSDAIRPEPSAAIFAEAAGWLVDFREGYIDAAGERRFYAWLTCSPEHIQAYMEAAALWNDIPRLATGMDIDVEAIVAQVRELSRVATLDGSLIRHPDRRRWRASRRRWLLTAGALAASLAAVAVMVAWPLVSGSTYATAIGEQRSITLHDGTTIELGARSRIRVHLTDRGRDVELLTGQALFNVANDPVRPFAVTTNRTRVRVVGTQFGVQKRTSGTTVTVFEGRVSVSSDSLKADTKTPPEEGSGAIYLTAGEQLTVPQASPDRPRRPHAADTRAVTGWTERTLTFDDAPLSDAVEEFNRYNDKQIILADPSLQSIRISGVFAANKPSSLLHFLTDQMHLDVSSGTDRIEISKAR